MRDENIICFAKDWREDPTSCDHVLLQLAEHNRVLWLNSISMRVPTLSDRRDLTKIVQKIRQFLGGPGEVRERLWVYTPLVLPLPHSKLAVALNRCILGVSLAILRRRLGMRDFQLWSFLPNVADYVGGLGESVVVYYCVDEWSQIPYVDGAKMAALEEALCRKADIVFATARSLEESRRHFQPETYLALHGVDHAHFAMALAPATAVAQEIASLPQPTIGFFGVIQEWIDLDLIAYLAERRPDWTFALVGRVAVDVSRLTRYPNVRLLGRRPYSVLPGYCKGFAAGIIPFQVNELTVHVNPIKLREYLSAGLPVVSTDLPEVRAYQGLCAVARDYEGFLSALDAALQEDSPEARRRRSEAMRAETWERKVEEIGERVLRARDARRLRGKAERCAN